MTDSNYYVSGGTLPTTALSYVKRSSDDVLFQALMEGDFCYILTSRQMGKSSITTQTAKRLRGAGVKVALLDFSGISIDLRDFSEEEASQIRSGLGRDEATNRLLIQRILYWTGGHPYLTQRLCREVAERTAVVTARGVDETCRDVLLSSQMDYRDDNLT